MLEIPKAWIGRWRAEDSFDQLFALEGKVYREKKGRKTVLFTLDGRHYFAKIHRGVGWKEIVKNLLQFRLPVLSAKNEWRAIQRLEQLGIKTMRLVAYGKRGWNPARLQSFVITERLADTVSLEDFCRNWPTSPPSHALKRALIEEVAEISRTLHENGVNHRDLYICHFLLDVSAGRKGIDPGRLQLYLIDLHRMQIRRRVPRRWQVKDIGGLYFSALDIGLTRTDFCRFVKVYTGKGLRETFVKDKRFWQAVRSRAIKTYRRHFKKEPVWREYDEST